MSIISKDLVITGHLLYYLVYIIIIIIYSLASEPAGLILIAGMLCKLPEWTTLGNYFFDFK